MRNLIVVISSNAIAREGLSRIFEDDGFNVFASAGRVDEVVWPEPGENILALVDLNDPVKQVDAVQHIRECRPEAKCIIMSDAFDFHSMMEVFRHGAQGYVVKDMSCKLLLASLKLASLGQKILPPDLVTEIDKQMARHVELPDAEEDIYRANLSQREMDVLCCLMAGYSNKVIARRLDLSEATVKVHVKAILRKLKVGNRTQAAIWATSHGVPAEAAPSLAVAS